MAERIVELLEVNARLFRVLKDAEAVNAELIAKMEGPIPEFIGQQINSLKSELAEARKYILNHGQGLPDHACAACVPHSDILIDGFVCAYHAALKEKP